MTDTVQIDLPQTFTYEDHSWFFEESRKAMDHDADRLELNCQNVNYLDSAALGMIAYLHKQLKTRGKQELIVKVPTEYCDDVFHIANMYTHYVRKSPRAA